ncbi:MAG: type III-A CRISPR-associated protein Csm2 [Bryobacter sp.]|nr:type III-A CRISPR-associated protein Csm2 [Bryobacter sp.]
MTMADEVIESTLENTAEKAAEKAADKPAAEKKPETRAERPPQGDRPPSDRGPRPEGRGPRPNDRGGNERGGNDRGSDRRGPRGNERGGERGGHDRGGDRGHDRGRGDYMTEIDIEKLIGDSLYLDNQAHAIVARLRDMDSGTKSQLRRFYNAVRRACRTPEADRQHEFVMLRARLAYTIARHGLRSLDVLEKLLLQVTRKNDQRGYERFRDLFEAIVAYNE